MTRIYKLAIGVGIALCVLGLAEFDMVGQKTRRTAQDEAQTLIDRAKKALAAGDFDEAERLLKRALAIREKVSDAEHPDTVTLLIDIAEQHYSTTRTRTTQRQNRC